MMLTPSPRSGRSDDAQRVRRALDDPRRLCAALGLSKGAEPQARGLIVLCPAHNERRPSCSVRVAADGTIACACFSCGWRGDALGLIAIVRGLDVRRDFAAVLAEGGQIASVAIEPPRGREPRLEPERRALDADAFDAVASALFELAPLDAQPDVAAYLAGRGVLDEARRASWGALPPPAAQGRIVAELAGRFGLDVLTRSGLARMGAAGRPVLSWSAHRVVIPWRVAGVSGLATAVQRRQLGTDGPRYVLAGETRWPYGVEDAIEDLGDATAIVFVEGAIDALARRAKYRAEGADRVVVGIPGVTAWRSSWAALASGRRAYVATDADAAGEQAAGAIIADLYAKGAAEVVRVRPLGAKDWAELSEVAA